MAKRKAEGETLPRWTPSQAAAIEHVGGDLLVSAAAGSGKTAVLAQRCVRLVTLPPSAGGTTIDRLLVVTFTEAAATEMRLRISGELRKRIDAAGEEAAGPELLRQAAMVDRAAISTLHGFCTRTLRAYFHEAGTAADGSGAALDPSFEILDADEARLMQDEVLEVMFRKHHLEDLDLEKAQKQSGFAALLESHAQGVEGRLKGFILNLHRMLVTLRAPEAWLEEAIAQYSVEGTRETMALYARHVAADLRREAARCADGLARLALLAGVEGLRDPMLRFWEMLQAAAADLEEEGMGAWERVREALQNFAWETIRTNKAVAYFGDLKDQTVEKAKEALKGFLKNEFSDGQTAMAMRGNLMDAEPAARTLVELAREFDAAFARAKRAQNRLDFSDLERLTLDMLTRPGSAAAADLRRRFDHVLVDEFQDINPLQAALLEAVVWQEKFGGTGNLFAVGDVKQSIYGFRLADPEEFLHLEEKLRSVKTHRAFVALQHNFRTAPRLLEGLNALFSRLITREVAGVDYTQDHQLVPPPGAEAKESGAPALELYVVVPEEQDEKNGQEEEDDSDEADERAAARLQLSPMELEARFVARKIEELIAEKTPIKLKDGTTRPLAYHDIAILLRSVKERALLFSRALAERNIPVHADLATGYFDAQEVRDALSLLAVLDNPYQDIPLGTLLLSPVGRFSHDDLARIRLAYPERDHRAFHELVHRFMLEAAGPDVELAERLQAFFRRLESYRQRTRVLPLHDALAEMYDDTGLLTYVAGLPGGVQRIANLQALHHRARQFSGFRKQGLYRFLRFIERLRESAADFGEAAVLSEASDVVRILSVHKSKGLEFPVVFASTLGAKFNLGRTEPVMVDRDHKLALTAADEERNIFIATPLTRMALARNHRLTRAEELRLLYVALTRARERLILTGAAKAATWENAQKIWARRSGPLPAYLLLTSQSFFDVLLPAAAAAAMPAQVIPMAGPPAAKLVQQDAAAGATRLEQVVAQRRGKAALDPQVTALIRRLEYVYPQMPLARLQALFTVSELKKLSLRQAAALDEEQAAELLPTPAAGFKEILERGPLQRSAGATRGVATHRLLELLDFARVDSAGALREFISAMVETRRLSEEEAGAIDVPSILWFLQTAQGQQLRELARDGSAGPVRLLREVPFVVAMEEAEIPDVVARACLQRESENKKDLPELRGVIDVLLAGKKEAQLLDYKTDSAFTIGASLPMYEQQMRYYARAVEACLGVTVVRAELVLLASRTVHQVL